MHAQAREIFLQGAHHTRYQTVGVQGFGAVVGFEGLVDHRKQGHDRDFQLHALLGHRQQQIQAEPLHAGHGCNWHALCLSIHHKNRVDQVMGGQAFPRTRLRVKVSRRRRRGRPAGKGA